MKTIKTTPIFTWLQNESKRINFLYGSAGSGKSYQVAIYFIRKLYQEKDISILVTRKTTPSLRLTAYKLVLEILDKYFTGTYELNKTEMIIKYRNNEIIFKGMDDPAKIRSMDLNYAWLEECTEFTLEDYQQILLRIRRPNSNGINQVMCTTNPISIFHWTYTDLYTNPDPSIAKHKSLWSDNPFLDPTYISELQKLEGNYRKIFLDGEFGMLEGLVFPNFEIYEKVYDTVKDYCYGVDFGYVHKSSLVKIIFLDSGKFITDELLAESGLTNTALIDRVKEIIPENDQAPIYCDSAEPARINEMYENSLNVYKAHKDIKSGIDYCIQNFLGVTSKSINLIKELRMYSFQKNQMNELMPEVVKKFDDSICAMRYGAYTHSLCGNRFSMVLPISFR